MLISLPLAAPIGLSPLHILTLCGPERVLVASTELLDDLSRLTTPGWLSQRRAVARAVDQVQGYIRRESGGGGGAEGLELKSLCTKNGPNQYFLL